MKQQNSDKRPFIERALFLLVILLGPGSALANEAPKEIALTEKALTIQFRQNAVISHQTEAATKQAEFQAHLAHERFQPRIYSMLQHQESKERALIPVQPVLSPVQNAVVGVKKNLPRGADVSTELFSQQLSTADGTINEATQVGGRVRLGLDLWRNFWGKLDQATLNSKEAQRQKQKLLSDYQLHAAELEARKLYWSWVATEESIHLAEELIESAKKQLRDAQARARSQAADRGEVARYQAQVQSRKATLHGLEYQREQIITALKKMIPTFNGQDLKLAPVSLDSIEKQFGRCSQQILSESRVPRSESLASQILEWLEKEHVANLGQARQHSSIDVNLEGTLQYSGTDNSYSGAQQDLTNHNRSGYAVGLNVVIPIGNEDKKSEQALIAAQEKAYLAEQSALVAEMGAVHTETQQALRILSNALESQSANSKWLATSLAEMRKKFRQGRVPVANLVIEQDALFAAQLNNIDIQRQVIHALYDYFKVFSEYSCSLNRI